MIKFRNRRLARHHRRRFYQGQRAAADRALARKMKDEGVDGSGFVVGYDRRFLPWKPPSGPVRSWRGGVPAVLVNQDAPTPLIMFAVKYYDMAYGMAVTASHNPAISNGIKVFVKGGRDADETVTADIGSISPPSNRKRFPLSPMTRRCAPARWNRSTRRTHIWIPLSAASTWTPSAAGI